MYTWIRFDVSALVTLRLSDLITATISALIGPQRFVIVLIWSMTENRGAYLMLRCQVNSVSPLPLAKSEPEWYLDCAMHLGTSVAACRFHRYVPALKLSVSFFCLKRLLFTHTSLGSFAQCFRLGFLFLLQKDLASQTSWQLHLQNTSYSVAAETWPGAHYPAFVE